VSEAESAILIALLCPRRKGYRNSSVRLSHGAAALGAQLPWAIGTIARRGVRTSHPSADGRTGWAKTVHFLRLLAGCWPSAQSARNNHVRVVTLPDIH